MARLIGKPLDTMVTGSRVWTPREVADNVANDAWSDSNLSKKVLSMHMDGANGSTVFTDLKGHPFTAYGNAQVTTSSPLMGTGSALFDGNGDYIETPHSQDFVLDGDFTLRLRQYNDPLGAAQPVLIAKGSAANASFWRLQLTAGNYYWTSGNGTNTSYYNYGANISGASVHLEVGRTGGYMYFFVNGVLMAAASTTTYPHLGGTLGSTVDVLRIGDPIGGGGWQFAGKIDEVELYKGVCLHTASFTPPDKPFRNY